MKTGKLIIISFLLGTLIIQQACQSDDEELISYPQTYQTTSIQEVNTAKLYTYQGEVRNASTIEKFISRYDLSGNFSTNKTTESYEGTISLVSADSATVTTPEKTETLKIEKDNHWMFLYPKDSSNIINAHPSIIDLGTYKPGYKIYNIPLSSGFTSCIKTKIPYIFSITNDEIILPVMNVFQLERYDATNFRASQYLGYNNTFDKKYLNQLGTADTLLVQEYSILFKKINN